MSHFSIKVRFFRRSCLVLNSSITLLTLSLWIVVKSKSHFLQKVVSRSCLWASLMYSSVSWITTASPLSAFVITSSVRVCSCWSALRSCFDELYVFVVFFACNLSISLLIASMQVLMVVVRFPVRICFFLCRILSCYFGVFAF